MDAKSLAELYNEEYLRGVLLKRHPVADSCPLIFDVPRSGSDYPKEFRSPASFDDVRRNVSMYVEELYENAPAFGATWLFACFPNTYIDANRNELDIDEALISGEPLPEFSPSDRSLRGMGLIPKFCGDGSVLLHDAPIPVEDLLHRIENYHRPYHLELSACISRFHENFGAAYHVSCHSMSSRGSKAVRDVGSPRSDFDIGDGHGKTCSPAFVEVVRNCLSGFGYDVTVNKHFAGAESIHRHAAPTKGLHSLQIEINRSLYMDENTYRKNENFETVKEHLTLLAQQLSKFTSS